MRTDSTPVQDLQRYEEALKHFHYADTFSTAEVISHFSEAIMHYMRSEDFRTRTDADRVGERLCYYLANFNQLLIFIDREFYPGLLAQQTSDTQQQHARV